MVGPRWLRAWRVSSIHYSRYIEVLSRSPSTIGRSKGFPRGSSLEWKSNQAPLPADRRCRFPAEKTISLPSHPLRWCIAPASTGLPRRLVFRRPRRSSRLSPGMAARPSVYTGGSPGQRFTRKWSAIRSRHRRAACHGDAHRLRSRPRSGPASATAVGFKSPLQLSMMCFFSSEIRITSDCWLHQMGCTRVTKPTRPSPPERGAARRRDTAGVRSGSMLATILKAFERTRIYRISEPSATSIRSHQDILIVNR